jgi:hypothetical protein
MFYLKKLSSIMGQRQEMEDRYFERTNRHIKLVQKYIKTIQALNLPEIDSNLLTLELDHDTGKWISPEYEPYVHITWRYYQQSQGIEYKVPEELDEHEATYHHVKTHKHHPEYWDDTTTKQVINPKNRDKPSGEQVDATAMPLTYVASMMADWFAMSEEKNTDVRDWIRMNVNIRWKFSPNQVKLMNTLVEKIEIDQGELGI